MRRRCLVLVVAALAAVGCGSTNKKASQTTASSPTSAASSTSTTTPTTAAAADCNKLGINPTGMREGTCTHAGITYVIVDENHTLKLHSLTARLNGIHTTSSLSAGKRAAAQGKFVVLPITLTNRLGLPQAFDRSGTQQAGLILAGTVYKEDTSVEQGSDPSSCLNHKTPLPSGKSETCDVIFDVPVGSAAELGKHGSGDLYVVDFGSDLASSTSSQTVGQIRLYP